eukprot:TRINITY_DN11937_c0_g1_i1.p1 TRINITY_DN11937_c0_g1~~TRINITY_DN11937_c0_g1_i1.p1  ORF type:complete len:261 (-),score=36.91 TRINITY_DN11937_c0_g1_i1:408-1190(-)
MEELQHELAREKWTRKLLQDQVDKLRRTTQMLNDVVWKLAHGIPLAGQPQFRHALDHEEATVAGDPVRVPAPGDEKETRDNDSAGLGDVQDEQRRLPDATPIEIRGQREILEGHGCTEGATGDTEKQVGDDDCERPLLLLSSADEVAKAADKPYADAAPSDSRIPVVGDMVRSRIGNTCKRGIACRRSHPTHPWPKSVPLCNCYAGRIVSVKTVHYPGGFYHGKRMAELEGDRGRYGEACLEYAELLDALEFPKDTDLLT